MVAKTESKTKGKNFCFQINYFPFTLARMGEAVKIFPR